MKPWTIGFLCLALVSWVVPTLSAQTRINQPFQQDGAIMQFITVEPREVRVEIVAQCNNLLRHLSVQLEAPNMIRASEKDAVLTAAINYFETLFIYLHEGAPTRPSEKRGFFLNLGDPESVTQETHTDEAVSDAVIGLSFSYRFEQTPNSFEVLWNELPTNLKRLPTQIWTQDEVLAIELSDYLLSASWADEMQGLKLPSIEPVAITSRDWIGRPKLDEESAKNVIGSLIQNIYYAFEYRNESEVYDQLAISVSGEQLATIYLEHRKRVESIARGGPQAKIQKIEVGRIHSATRSGKSYVVKASWRIQGEVSHFGHVHQRENAYHARLELKPSSDNWKIEKIQILEENRIR